MRSRILACFLSQLSLLSLLFSSMLEGAENSATAAPQSFFQETATFFLHDRDLPAGKITLLDIEPEYGPTIVINGAWYCYNSQKWQPISNLALKSANQFVFRNLQKQTIQVDIPTSEVRQILRGKSNHWLATQRSIYEVSSTQKLIQIWNNDVRQMAVDSDGSLLVASKSGLWRRNNAQWQRLQVMDDMNRDVGATNLLGVAVDAKNRLWCASRAGLGFQDKGIWRIFEGKDGLPYNDFTQIFAGNADSIWAATHLGLVHFDGKNWHYRQGKRWLPHDDVQQVAVDGNGRTWCVTPAGLALIEHKPMTLSEKAALYNFEIDTYIKRTRFGFVAEAPLREPGNKATANPHDSDNDGLWTSMYGAAQAFAYASTRQPAAKERARKAFDALRFLQKVTQGGSHSPPLGYVARTIRSTQLPDPNIGRLQEDRANQAGDKLWKAYEPRWPKSADALWFWKSDTSSDELDGHFFFYPLYYDFCADTEAEKERVRDVVRQLTDHFITHNFALIDHDGTPTRWAVYSPEALNHDPNWVFERGLKSLSMLSYLSVAAHITGDAKYEKASRELIEKHAYAHNAMVAKTQLGFGSGNQSDDEMAFMCYYNLLRYTHNTQLRELIRYSFFSYWALEQPEMNPFFNFSYAAHNIGKRVSITFGSYDLSPWAGWLEDAMATLYGFPLDRLNWNHQNSHRIDLQLLPRQQSVDLYEPSAKRGFRVNGKVLPIENRHFNHWNTDPWRLDYGGHGNELAAGTVFLLPYYMGLYHGFIESEPSANQ